MPEQPQPAQEIVVAGDPFQRCAQQLRKLTRRRGPTEPSALFQFGKDRRIALQDVCGVRTRRPQFRKSSAVQTFSPSARRAACTAGRCWIRSRYATSTGQAARSMPPARAQVSTV